MSIHFLIDIDIKHPCPESQRFSDMIENNDDGSSRFSKFNFDLARFCYEYNYEITMLFGNERKKIFLYTDIYDLIVFDLIREIRDLKRLNSLNIGFVDSQLELDSYDFYDNKVKLKLLRYGNTCEKYFTESIVDELINTLIKLANDIILLSVEAGYVNQQEANNFLKTLHS